MTTPNSFNEFKTHEESLWGRERRVVRICKDQNRLIVNELKRAIPEVDALSEAKVPLFILHILEEFLKQRNPDYKRFCETNFYKKAGHNE